jgi:tRNA nucleotidyltransferase (CCA-adding enzyme)
VENGQVIGIVTRTDLVKLWSMPERALSVEDDIDQRLIRALSPATLELVHAISATADGMGYSIYFVGGLVRDLLLGLPIGDIDIVVEGDAIALARRLRRQFGGRTRSHGRFGTAKWLMDDPATRKHLVELLEPDDADRGPDEGPELPHALDFVTARTEFYTHPTALPEVERSSIKQDLHRRDFTINTLAIRLDPDHFGQLLDFYGGESDLRQGLIRVLHSLSFIEDPTRILRAARLEARLDFEIELRTEQLIADAISMLDRVSGDRIRHELEFIFLEQQPERALCRLATLGVLEAICPHLSCDRWLKTRFERLRQAEADPVWQLDDKRKIFGYMALMLYRLPMEKIRPCARRLKLGREVVKRLNEVASLKEHMSELEDIQPNSTLYRRLSPYSSAARLVIWAAENEAVGRQMRKFEAELKEVRTLLDGRYLIEKYGLRPSPLFGDLLDQLRDARLDGEVITREDEKALLEQLLNQIEDKGGREA